MKLKLRPRCYFDINIGHSPAGRIIFELYNDLCPKTAENFLKLSTGDCGISATTNKKLHYLNSSFHRVIKGFMIQGGDFTNGDGTGGESIYGDRFEDENLEIPHDRPFLLSMANCGPNMNGSQFFITTKATPHLNKKHVVFGHVVSGENLIESIENLPVNSANKPVVDATIANCGELIPVRKKKIKKNKANSEESSSSKEKKNKKSKKRKHKNKKKSKKADNELSEEINPNCSVRPDEIPEVPKPFFLYRGSLKEDLKVKEKEPEVEDQFSKYVSKDAVGRSGRTIKGRGTLRYLSQSPHSRSETPPHWRTESHKLNKEKEIPDKDTNLKRKRSFSNSSNDDHKEINNNAERGQRYIEESGKSKPQKRTRNDSGSNLPTDKIKQKYVERTKSSPEDVRRKIDYRTADSYDRNQRDHKRNDSGESRKKFNNTRNGSNDSREQKINNRRNRSDDSNHHRNPIQRNESDDSLRLRRKGNKKSMSPVDPKERMVETKYLKNDRNAMKNDYRIDSPPDVRSRVKTERVEPHIEKKADIYPTEDDLKQSRNNEKSDLKLGSKTKEVSGSSDSKFVQSKEKTSTKKAVQNPDFDKHERIVYDYAEENGDSVIPKKSDKHRAVANMPKEVPKEYILRRDDVTSEVYHAERSETKKMKDYAPRRRDIYPSSRSKSLSRSPEYEKRGVQSPPAHLIARWRDRREKIMDRHSPVSRSKDRYNSRSRHSPRRYSPRYSTSPTKLDKSIPTRPKENSPRTGKSLKDKSKHGRSSSGTADSSASSDGSSVVNSANRPANSNLKPETTPNKKDESIKLTEKPVETVNNDKDISVTNGKATGEPVMVIKGPEKPKVLSQWKTEEDKKDKSQGSILAKLRETDDKQKSVAVAAGTSAAAVPSSTGKRAPSPISQSISKYRSPSGSRSPRARKSSYSSSSSSRSRSRRRRSDSRRRRQRYSRRSTSRSRRRYRSRSRSYRHRSSTSYSAGGSSARSRSRHRSRRRDSYGRDYHR